MADVFFWSSLLLLCASTVLVLIRTRGRITGALLVPAAWVVLIPLSVLVRPYAASAIFPDGFQGAPRDNMYYAISIANVAFVVFQAITLSPLFARVEERLAGWAGVRATVAGPVGRDQLLRRFVLGLTVLATGLAIIHWAVMPRVPLWTLVVGFSNPLQPTFDRETADKLLAVPTLVRYLFTWNSSVLWPVLFCATVLMRWRALAVFVGVFGLIYVSSTLEKFPSEVFLLVPFIAVAIRHQRAIWSVTVIAGAVLSLLGPLAINQAPLVSQSVHSSLHIAPPAGVPPQSDQAAKAFPGCTVPTQNIPAGPTAKPPSFSWTDLPLSARDLVLRRIGAVPAEVTYGWFAYFPAVHPYLHGSGWEPWNVLRSNYRNPSNLVGLWMYCGHVTTLPTVSAYASFVADGWAEFGLLGVVLACIGLLLIALLIELLRSFRLDPFCLACYAPAVVLFATLPPRAGLLATFLSSGLWLSPALCFLYLALRRAGNRALAAGQHLGRAAGPGPRDGDSGSVAPLG